MNFTFHESGHLSVAAFIFVKDPGDLLKIRRLLTTNAWMSDLQGGHSKRGNQAALTQVDGLRYTDRDEARYPSGKGEVCKTFMRGFDSHPRLQINQLNFR